MALLFPFHSRYYRNDYFSIQRSNVLPQQLWVIGLVHFAKSPAGWTLTWVQRNLIWNLLGLLQFFLLPLRFLLLIENSSIRRNLLLPLAFTIYFSSVWAKFLFYVDINCQILYHLGIYLLSRTAANWTLINVNKKHEIIKIIKRFISLDRYKVTSLEFFEASRIVRIPNFSEKLETILFSLYKCIYTNKFLNNQRNDYAVIIKTKMG